MDQNEYPRSNVVSGPYPKDKTWGIVIIVLSALGVCCGIAGIGAGGILGAVGAGAAAAGNTADARQTAVAAGAGGGLVMLISGAIMVSSIIQMVGGFGIMKGLRWGFLVTGILAAIGVLLNVANLPQGILGILINGFIAYYCYSRLSGKEGPTPV